MHWAIWDAMFKAQNALEGVISNFPNRLIGILMRRTVFPLGRPYVVPSDQLGHEVARLLIEPSATRDRLTAGMYLPKSETDVIGTIEAAVEATLAAEPIEARIREAQKSGRLIVKVGEDRPTAAREAGIINAEELTVVRRAKRLLDIVVRVDDFAQDLGVSLMRPPATTAAGAPGTVARREAA
jgi:acyl-CoA dehydrogenase